MEKYIPFILIIITLCNDPNCNAQTPIKVSDPRLELRDNIIHISYDILNSNPSDKFTVSVDITDADGNKINALALDGDIGEDVNGGNNKHITWDLEVDKIFMKASIFVKINAKATLPPEPEITQIEEDTGEQDTIQVEDRSEGAVEPEFTKEDLTTEKVTRKDIDKEDGTEKNAPMGKVSQSYNRAGIVIQSFALPGLGLARVTGNPHWIRGVAGYGCIAGSVILFQQAVSNYDGIADLTDYDDQIELLNKSRKQDNISEVLAYTAIGIWVTDFIWTVVGTSDLRKKALYGEIKGLSVRSSIDPLSYVLSVSIRYSF